MTDRQEKYHWRLWAALKRPGNLRKAAYAEAGVPSSHREWEQVDFDKWVAYVKAQTQPANLNAQVAQEQMPERRRRHTLDLVIAAMGLPEEYVDAIVARQCRGRFVSYAQMPESAMWNLLIALKLECRRRWRRKPDLLHALRETGTTLELDEQAARTAASKALRKPVTDTALLTYDELVLVLGAVKQLVEVPW